MQKYIIVTESGADLPDHIINRDDVYSLPMHVSMDGVDYTDYELTTEELCSYYDRTKKVPTTSAVNPEQYREVFEKINAEMPDALIIHISYSSVVSCTYQNAVIAADGLKNIHHIDTLNVSIGQGFIVMKTLDLLKENPEIELEDLIAAIEQYSKKTKFVFIPGNLDYLRAGGRVSNAQYLGAAVLKIKPLIELIEGKLISTKKYRGHLTAVAKNVIDDFIADFNADIKELNIVETPRLGGDIVASIKACLESHGVQTVHWLKTGCVIASHAGPGGFGIAGFMK